jgi:hypothetical protein
MTSFLDKKQHINKKELKVTLFYLGNSDLRIFDYLFKNLKISSK